MSNEPDDGESGHSKRSSDHGDTRTTGDKSGLARAIASILSGPKGGDPEQVSGSRDEHAASWQRVGTFRSAPRESAWFRVYTDVGGEAPILPDVIGSYIQVDQDLTVAFILSEAYISTLYDIPPSERRNRPNRRDYLASMLLAEPNDAPPTVLSKLLQEELRHASEYRSQSMDRPPTARVHASAHVNPLETVIAVSATSAVMLIAVCIWAACKWKRSQNANQVGDAITEQIKAISLVLADGDAARIKALEPIAKAAIGYAMSTTNDKTRVEVALPGAKFKGDSSSGGQTTGQKDPK